MKNVFQKIKLIHIPIVIMLLLGALMIGLTDYITAGFNFDILTNYTFWVNIISTNIGTISVVIAVLLMVIDNFKEKNILYLDITNYIINYYRNSDYKSAVFRKFCGIENKKEKKRVYLNRLNTKFSKLKPNHKDLEISLKGTEEEKENNKYCQKIKKIELMSSEEYMSTYLDKLRIKYDTITEDLIFTGVPTNSYQTNYIVKHKGIKVTKDLLPRYLLTFALTCFASSLVPDLAEGITLVTVFKTAVKLFSVCSQIYFAYTYANKYCQEVVMHDLNFRNNTIRNYDLWLNTQIKEVSVDGKNNL